MFNHTTRWTSKPPLGSQINWSHPLSRGLVGCWLMNEGGGRQVRSLVGNYYANFNTGNSWKPDSIFFPGVDGNQRIVPTDTRPSGTFAYFLICSRDVGTGTSGVSRVQEVIVTRIAGQSTGWEFCLGNGFGGVGDKDKPRISDYSATPGTATAYVNGVLQSSINPFDVSLVTGKFYSIAFNCVGMSVGNDYNWGTSSGGFYLTGKIKALYRWNRNLSPQEIQSLYVSPYQFIQPMTQRFVISGAGEPPTELVAPYGFMTTNKGWW